MIRSETRDEEWKLINFRVVDSLLAAEMLHELYGRHRPSVNAIRFRNTIVTYEGGTVRAYAPQAEWDQLEAWFGRRFLMPSSELREELWAYCARPFLITQGLVRDVDRITSQTADEVMLSLIEVQHKCLGELYEINLVQVEHALVGAVKTQLKQVASPEHADDLLAQLSLTSVPTAAGRERTELDAIKAEHKQSVATLNGPPAPALEEALHRHLSKWGHLRNAYGRNAVTVDDLLSRMRHTGVDTGKGNGLAHTTFAASEIDDPLLRANVELLRGVGSLRDRQKETMGKVGELRSQLLDRLSVLVSVPRADLNHYLLSELCMLVQEKRTLDDMILKQRRKYVVLRRTEHLTLEIPSEIPKRDAEQISATFQGRCASPGEASGRAAIVRGAGDIQKVAADCIMLAPGTDFDVIDAMHRARAIVTEEGGLLSHAAVIARELGIPCVVGVPRVTDLIADGEWIEVDASRGVVKRSS